MRRTTKLTESGHRGLQDLLGIYVNYVFHVFTFKKIQKVMTF